MRGSIRWTENSERLYSNAKKVLAVVKQSLRVTVLVRRSQKRH